MNENEEQTALVASGLTLDQPTLDADSFRAYLVSSEKPKDVKVFTVREAESNVDGDYVVGIFSTLEQARSFVDTKDPVRTKRKAGREYTQEYFFWIEDTVIDKPELGWNSIAHRDWNGVWVLDFWS